MLALNPSHNSVIISGKGKPALLLPADRIDAFAQNMANYPARVREIRKRDDRKGVEKSLVGFKLPEGKPL